MNKSIKKHKSHKRATTAKRRRRPAFRHGKNAGWICIEIAGEAYERGFSHGTQLVHELALVKKRLPFILKNELKISYSQAIEFSHKNIEPVVKKAFPEYYEEIRGISEGAISRGLDFSLTELIAWNGLMTLYSHFVDGGFENAAATAHSKRGGGEEGDDAAEGAQRCSAFIATGDATSTGEIVMSHNSHVDFATGELFNIILHVIPPPHGKGTAFTMQTAPGLISSTTDWFITDAGMIGCETTIAGIRHKPRLMESPHFCRIREAMQYGRSIDDYISIMKKHNAGDYSCAWLFGDIKTGEIARLELGIIESSVDRTFNGAFIGANEVVNPALSAIETTNDIGLNNPATSVGSRHSRLEFLVNQKYYGKLDAKLAKKIIADHYDMYLHRDVGATSVRTICKHVESANPKINGTNPRRAYDLRGAYDGKVVTSKMAARGEFWARFGSSCGRAFYIKKHVKKHPQYKKYLGMVDDLPSHPWVVV